MSSADFKFFKGGFTSISNKLVNPVFVESALSLFLYLFKTTVLDKITGDSKDKLINRLFALILPILQEMKERKALNADGSIQDFDSALNKLLEKAKEGL